MMAAQQLFGFMDTPTPSASVEVAEPALKPKRQPTKSSQPTKPSQSPNPPQPTSRQSILEKLRTQVGCITSAAPATAPTISTGCETMDNWLPTSGLPTDGVIEWIGSHESAGATSLSLIAAANRLRQLDQQHHTALPLVIVDIEGTFYPPAAIALGIAARQMILVRPKRRNGWIWSIDQALRCDAVAGVWASIPSRLNDRDARRFQLATESGRKPAFFVRRENVRGTPGFSEVQFHVAASIMPLPSKITGGLVDRQVMNVTLDRCRDGAIGQSVAVGMDDQATLFTVSSDAATRHETATVHLAHQLAHPASAQPTTGRTATPAARRNQFGREKRA